MIAGVAAWSARHPWTVLLGMLALALAGEAGRRALRNEVLPELADPQIAVVADWMGHPAADVASSVTKVLTEALQTVPGATAVRGTSMTGMAYVDVVLGSGSSLAGGREAVAARLAGVRGALPANVRLQIGPAAPSTGWVLEYALVDPTHGQPARALRRLQEDVVRPALAAVDGVAEVATFGGVLQEALVEARPEELRAREIAFTDVVSTLRTALAARRSMSVADVEALPIAAGDRRATARIGEVARVRIGDEMTPTGVADLGGLLRAVGGIVVARPDANLDIVLGRVASRIDELRARLPAGVQVVIAYDRRDLASRVGRTLLRALGEEVAVVVLVIVVFLVDWRSALVPLATLPLVLLLAFGCMWLLRVPANVMSLGGIGIALGMAVDADVVALEACHRRREDAARGGAAQSAGEGQRAGLVAAAASFVPAILTSLVIAAIGFLPVFAFTGETGRLLRPLALTKTLVIASAALVTLTAAPALRDRVLGGRAVPELANPITRWLVRGYRPLVHFALTRPALTLVTAVLAVCSCLPIAGRLGGEFLPRIDEGDVLFMPTTLPGASVHDVASELRRFDHAIGRFDEVAMVLGKAGRADTATDPAPMSMIETTVRLRPRAEWPPVRRVRWYSGWAPAALRRLLGAAWPEWSALTTPELVEKLDAATKLPGWSSAWTAPARARLDMMSTGVRTPIGVRVVARDTERLEALGVAIRAAAERVPGTRSAVFESLGEETRLEFAADPGALARHGVDAGAARAAADLVVAGGQVGVVEQDGRSLRLLVAPDVDARGDADLLREVTVRSSGDAARPVPLALLGRAVFPRRPASIRTEHGELVAYVYVDTTSGTDVLGQVQRMQRELSRAIAAGELSLGAGERIEWAGQYELLAAGQRRLAWIVPLVIASMAGLLYLQFRSLTQAALVLASVPFALVGSVWTLYLSGYPLSAPVWVGLLSVLGLATQTGVVMVVYIDDAFYRRVREGRLRSREDIVSAHAEGTVQRLRPKIMTVTTMGAGLLPLLWADGAGAEIMKRVAAPMLGGLVTSAFLTLEVLPVLYTLWRQSQLRRAERLGVPIEAVLTPGARCTRPRFRGNRPG